MRSRGEGFRKFCGPNREKSSVETCSVSVCCPVSCKGILHGRSSATLSSIEEIQGMQGAEESRDLYWGRSPALCAAEDSPFISCWSQTFRQDKDHMDPFVELAAASSSRLAFVDPWTTNCKLARRRLPMLHALPRKPSNEILWDPEGPSTQYLRTLVPKTIPLMVFGTRVLKYWVLGPSG